MPTLDAAVNFRGEIDPRFCITCRELLDWRAESGTQPDWFWNGDNHNPEHFVCRRRRLGLPPDPEDPR